MQAEQSVRAHALAALLDQLGKEEEVEEHVTRLAAEAAAGKVAASQAGMLIANRVLGRRKL